MPINKIQFQPGQSLPDFFAQFGTEAQCKAALEKIRWPDGFTCPDYEEMEYTIVQRGELKLRFRCFLSRTYNSFFCRFQAFHVLNKSICCLFEQLQLFDG